MTFWLTVIVLDYCESPNYELEEEIAGPHAVARSLTLQAVSRQGNSAGVFRPWSKEISPNRRAAGPTRSLVMQFDDEVRRARTLKLVPRMSLFRAAQPRKLCVQDGDGFGGGFASRRQ
jgi:hypothetical protein